MWWVLRIKRRVGGVGKERGISYEMYGYRKCSRIIPPFVRGLMIHVQVFTAQAENLATILPQMSSKCLATGITHAVMCTWYYSCTVMCIHVLPSLITASAEKSNIAEKQKFGTRTVAKKSKKS